MYTNKMLYYIPGFVWDITSLLCENDDVFKSGWPFVSLKVLVEPMRSWCSDMLTTFISDVAESGMISESCAAKVFALLVPSLMLREEDCNMGSVIAVVLTALLDSIFSVKWLDSLSSWSLDWRLPVCITELYIAI